MKRIIAFIIGAALILLGGISFIGALDLRSADATTEALAQAFLVPVSLFVIGGFVLWMGFQAGRR